MRKSIIWYALFILLLSSVYAAVQLAIITAIAIVITMSRTDATNGEIAFI